MQSESAEFVLEERITVRTLMEVKESWMMLSNARQLLRPSRSLSCTGGKEWPMRYDIWGGRTSRSLRSCSYVEDLRNGDSIRELDVL